MMASASAKSRRASRRHARRSPTPQERLGGDPPGRAAPKQGDGRRQLERRRVARTLERARPSVLHADEDRSGKATAQVDPHERAVFRPCFLPDDVGQRGLEALDDYFFPWTVVVARLEERITNVLKMNPAVEDARLLETVKRTLALGTPADLLPSFVIKCPQVLDGSMRRLSKEVEQLLTGQRSVALDHRFVDLSDRILHVRRPGTLVLFEGNLSAQQQLKADQMTQDVANTPAWTGRLREVRVGLARSHRPVD